jgi:26S proteasome regulatory subunit N9
MHPILDTLKSSTYDWLRALLFCFNSGNMDEFAKAIKSPGFTGQSLLVNAVPFLQQKLCLMTLVEKLFHRTKEERSKYSFEQISKDCRVNIDEVEHLIMKAFSLGLVKGKIDEVNQLVRVRFITI